MRTCRRTSCCRIDLRWSQISPFRERDPPQHPRYQPNDLTDILILFNQVLLLLLSLTPPSSLTFQSTGSALHSYSPVCKCRQIKSEDFLTARSWAPLINTGWCWSYGEVGLRFGGVRVLPTNHCKAANNLADEIGEGLLQLSHSFK